MLTRVEIDGFKSFENFSIDLPAFCVVVGPNASGKSNFFDALRLLSRLADSDFHEAAAGLRGRPHELFRAISNDSRCTEMRFAVEVLLDRQLHDDFGGTHNLKNTRVRYELAFELRRDEASGRERVIVTYEQASLIKREDDRLLKALPQDRQRTFRAWAPAQPSSPHLMSTDRDGEESVLVIRQDGKGGRKSRLAMGRSTRSYLSSIGTADQALHLYALRRELSALRFLHLDPASVGAASDMIAADVLDPRGGNLATVLARLISETSNPEHPEGVLTAIRQDLAALIPDVRSLRVQRDDVARKYQIFATLRDGCEFSSEVLSDGTLRLLALITWLHDDRRRGTLCFEEPENGLHEARIPGLIELLRTFATDLGQVPEDEELLSQIIVNSHSPVVLRALAGDEVIVADMVEHIDPAKRASWRKTRMRRGIVDQMPLGDEQALTRFETNLLLRRLPETTS